MATTLVLRNTITSGVVKTGAVYYDMLVDSFGSTTQTFVTDTVASGTEIQLTFISGSFPCSIAWVSGRVPSGGFTLTNITAIAAWFHESNMNANCGARARFYRLEPNGTETELGGGPFNDGAEFGTSAAQMDWTANVTDTAFSENDRLVLKLFLTNVGTMGGGHTCTLTINGASGSTGDSLITLNETVAFKAEDAIQDKRLLLHCNGTDGSTTVTDSSGLNHTLTANGNAQLDTAQQKFGTASLLFDGSEDWVDTTTSGDFAIGLNDFTIDMWFRLNTTGIAHSLYDGRGGNLFDSPGHAIYVASDNTVRYSTINTDRITSTSTISSGTWVHVAVTRSSGTTRLFINGTQEGGNFSDTISFAAFPNRPRFGGNLQDPSAGADMDGWLDEIRILVGTAAWTANFTPPTEEYDQITICLFSPLSETLRFRDSPQVAF